MSDPKTTLVRAERVGFLMGVLWVCKSFNAAANQVVQDQRGDLVANDGKTVINAILRTGDVKFANRLQELVKVLSEEAIEAANSFYPDFDPPPPAPAKIEKDSGP